MRIDKYLQISRLVKRRANAKEACDAGRVKINDRIAKPDSEVTIGDRLTLVWGHRKSEVEVLLVPEHNVPAAQAKTIYTLLGEGSGDSPAGEK